jgi:hypothetical protein
MRQDVDRGVGEEFDVVGAALQRGFDVAGIQDVEESPARADDLIPRSFAHLPVFDPRLRPDPL